MRLLRLLRHRVRSLFRGRHADADLAREMELHVDQLTRELIAGGLSDDQARRQARLEFGSAAAATEGCRDARRVRPLEDFAADSRYAWRVLRRSPGFTVTAIVSLALGLGANTAVFSLVDAVLLRPLPVHRPHELVFLDVAGSEGSGGAPPYPAFERLRHEATAYSAVAGFAIDDLKVEVDGRVEQVFGQVASGNYFDLLGLTPAAGRLLTPADEARDTPVAVIGYGYWQRRFGGDPGAIGRTLSFRHRVYTIVGVTPASFWGLQPGRQLDLTLPMSIEQELRADPTSFWFDAIARLRPDASVAAATAQTDAIFQSFMSGIDDKYGELRKKYFNRMELQPASHGLDRLRSRFSPALRALGVLAAVVLLIACANLGSLLLARGTARANELALRLAIGAARGRLFRQLVTETLWLFVIGAVAGMGVALLAVRVLTGFFAVGRSPIVLDVRVDWPLAAVSGLIALAAGLGTALWPAIRATRTTPHEVMKDGEARIAGARGARVTGRWLLAGQVALSMVLLVAALLSVRTIANLRGVKMGFDGAHVLTMSLDPEITGDSVPDKRRQFWRDALDRVRSTPGVDAASVSVLTPLSGRDTGKIVAVVGAPPRDGTERLIHVNHVSEDYFQTFGIPLVAGRGFTTRDTAASANVAIVNEAAVAFYFAGRSPIGASLDFGKGAVYQVVGVVGDTAHLSVRGAPPRFAFVPLWQPLEGITRISLAVSAVLPPEAVTRAVGDAVRAVHPNTLVSDVIPVADQISATMVSERLLATLATAFAALALGLAAMGLYGTLSYSVARRRSELGVRLALGAPRRRVAMGVIRDVLPPLTVGLATGLVVAVPLARSAERLLFGVPPVDPATYVVSLLVLAVAACVAAWLPIRRAVRVDPSETLRRA